MSIVSPAARILVTGASGFIGVQVSKTLVENGFRVLGTVRNAEKGEYLAKLLPNRFESIIVPDTHKPNAYDDAVKGVEGIIHLAALMPQNARGDPEGSSSKPQMTKLKADTFLENFIKPTVEGTLGLLDSIKRAGDDAVKRVILCSSLAAIGRGSDETHFNEAAIDLVKEKGESAPAMYQYAAAKVKMERAATQYVKDHKKSISFDVITVCPSWVFGPMLQSGSDAASISGSVKYLLSALEQTAPQSGDMVTAVIESCVDVRDLAEILSKLLVLPEASGERFVIAAHTFSWQMVFDALNEFPAFPNIPLGEPGKRGQVYPLPTSKKLLASLDLDHKAVFRPFEETIRDSVAGALERGWAQ